MSANRLAFALERLQSADWQIFEKFSAKFLASELPNYRNMAAVYGDKGRDGEIYCIGEISSILFQMSVTQDWEGKIKATIKRLNDNFKDISELIYVTNQEIGPAADDLKREVFRNNKILLDVRDRSWFVDRCDTNEQRRIASEELSVAVVDPILSSSKVTDRVGRALTSQEARIGFLHLSLDAQDKLAEKGLTKGCFESLTLAALHDTHSSNRIPSEEVVSRVQAMLPAVHGQQVAMYAENSLARLSKKGGKVKFWRTTRDYCLSNEEVKSLKAQLSQFILEEGEVEKEIAEALMRHVKRFAGKPEKAAVAAAEVKVIIEEALLAKGESFAARVAGGEVHTIDEDEFKKIIARNGLSGAYSKDHDQVVTAIASFLAEGSGVGQGHLRRLADAYTLFAFLRQTPDVQKVIVRMFGEGEIWLDTTAALPLLVETLVESDGIKRYTSLLKAVVNSGLSVFITSGVAEEIDSHLTRALKCSRMPPAMWTSRIPFVYSEYIAAGYDRQNFSDWIENFRGKIRPVEDIQEYLQDEFGIKVRNLTEEVDKAPAELKLEAENYWRQVHDRRRANRKTGSNMDPFTMQRLVNHDVECSVGILMLRRSAVQSDLGHKQWWLCLDSAAPGFAREMNEHVEGFKDASPVLNPDFLSEYLRIGPLRGAVDRDLRVSVPVLTDFARRRSISVELLEIAEKARIRSQGKPERIIRRDVRDALDEARIQLGIASEDALSVLDIEMSEII